MWVVFLLYNLLTYIYLYVITLQSINDIKINSPFSNDDERKDYIDNIIKNSKSKGFKFPDE